MRISVIIPTLQAETHLSILLPVLQKQSCIPDEIIIIDSSSTDQTIKVATAYQCITHVIDKKEFQHGRTRNRAVSLAHGDILVFMTQDALPKDGHFIEELISPLLNGCAQASFARQIAIPRANPLEKFSRGFNYPEKPFIRTKADFVNLGSRTFFFSNASSATLADIFRSLGGLSETVIVNEDMDYCARLILSGHSVAYQPAAVVYHAHDYQLSSLFHRYFDIGVYFSQANYDMAEGKNEGEGFRFFLGLIRYLTSQNEWFWMPRAFAETLIKYLAFHLGRRYHLFPTLLNTRLSAQPFYWSKM